MCLKSSNTLGILPWRLWFCKSSTCMCPPMHEMHVHGSSRFVLQLVQFTPLVVSYNLIHALHSANGRYTEIPVHVVPGVVGAAVVVGASVVVGSAVVVEGALVVVGPGVGTGTGDPVHVGGP